MFDCDVTELVIKNTFVDIASTSPQHAQRRCASVPKSTRLNKGIVDSVDENVPESQKTSQRPPAAIVSFGSLCDVSTDPGSMSDEESVASVFTRTSTSTLPGNPETPTVHQRQHMVLDASPQTLGGQPVRPATKLSTEAKQFTPGCCMQPKPYRTNCQRKKDRKSRMRWRWKCQQVVLAVKEVLTACLFVQSVELVEEKYNFSVNAVIRPECFQSKEQALAYAMQALLDSAEKSIEVWVLGYQSMPFLVTSDGFFAKLGAMGSLEEPCWDTFCHGCCANEGTCSLQHPLFQVPVYVNVRIADQ